MCRPKTLFCNSCGVERNGNNWLIFGSVCRICNNEKLKHKRLGNRISNPVQKIKTEDKIKTYATEIVKNYKIKSSMGLLCACKDLHKYFKKHNINPYMPMLKELDNLACKVGQSYMENSTQDLLENCYNLYKYYVEKKVKITEVN